MRLTFQEFYGDTYEAMKKAERDLLEMIEQYPMPSNKDVQTIVYVCSRIKHPDSMICKLEKKGLSVSCETALTQVFDAIGVRIVCSFNEDVYRVASWLSAREDIRIIQEKDYIAYPKPNGYRSYHLQIEMHSGGQRGLRAEIQIRTIAIDFWATLEHQMKYKKNLEHEGLIRDELKRCADEIASVDLSMQTIRDIIMREE